MSGIQPPPWDGYDPAQACWIHYRNEPTTRWTFIVCFECGHVWTRWALVRAYFRSAREMGCSIRESVKRPSRIFFCQECIHDF